MWSNQAGSWQERDALLVPAAGDPTHQVHSRGKHEDHSAQSDFVALSPKAVKPYSASALCVLAILVLMDTGSRTRGLFMVEDTCWPTTTLWRARTRSPFNTDNELCQPCKDAFYYTTAWLGMSVGWPCFVLADCIKEH